MYELQVEGMSCMSCSKAITNALKAIDPQAQVSVDLPSQSVKVQSQKAIEEVVRTIEEAGYTITRQRTA